MTGEFEPLPRMEDSRFYHSPELTADQADQLNAHYNFVIVGGWHFRGSGDNRPPEQSYAIMQLMTSYLSAAKRDKMFIEGRGYSGVPDAELLRGTGTFLAPQIEALRRSTDIDTFNYVAAQAAMRDVEVDHADIHKEVLDTYLRQAGVANVEGIKHKGEAQVRHYYQTRSAQAAYTVKDDALAHLDEVRLLPEKPTYMLVFGEGHVRKMHDDEKTVPEFYAEMGLDAQTILMSDVVKGFFVLEQQISQLPGLISKLITDIHLP